MENLFIEFIEIGIYRNSNYITIYQLLLFTFNLK